MKASIFYGNGGRGHKERSMAIASQLLEKGWNIETNQLSKDSEWAIYDFPTYGEVVPFLDGNKQAKVAVINDIFSDGIEADLVVNFIKGDRLHYHTPKAKILRGRKYVPIRHGVSKMRSDRYLKTFKREIRIVIDSASNGTDYEQKIARSIPNRIEYAFLRADYDVKSDVLGEYLFIGDGGLSAWERLWLGIPQIIVPSGYPQMLVAKEIERLGAAGTVRTYDEIRWIVEELTNDPMQYNNMAENAFNASWEPGQKLIVNEIEALS